MTSRVRRVEVRGRAALGVALVALAGCATGEKAGRSVEQQEQLDRDKTVVARAQALELAKAVEIHKLLTGRYPSNAEGLTALTLSLPGAQGPILERLPLDPWKQPWRYENPGVHNPASFDLYSAGPDTYAGNDDDVGNW
ncbi:MAG: type II secretion system protein GspG [Myxococcota bacterium]